MTILTRDQPPDLLTYFTQADDICRDSLSNLIEQPYLPPTLAELILSIITPEVDQYQRWQAN